MKEKTPQAAMSVVHEKAYTFVPPRDSRFWPWFGRLFLPSYLKKTHGLESWEFEGLDKLKHPSRQAMAS